MHFVPFIYKSVQAEIDQNFKKVLRIPQAESRLRTFFVLLIGILLKDKHKKGNKRY